MLLFCMALIGKSFGTFGKPLLQATTTSKISSIYLKDPELYCLLVLFHRLCVHNSKYGKKLAVSLDTSNSLIDQVDDLKQGQSRSVMLFTPDLSDDSHQSWAIL